MLRHLRWSLLWAAIILWLCLIPGKALPEWDWFAVFDLDKLVHGGMFFVLAVLLAQALRSNGSPTRYILWACIISVAYGLFTEFMQGLEALGRRTDINDMIANTIGAVSAGGFVNWRVKKGWHIVPFAFLR
jgi:VanZ family protein